MIMVNKYLILPVILLLLISCNNERSLNDLEVTNTAKVYATAIRYDIENGERSNKGKEVSVYGYDERNNLIENYDLRGLYLVYKFDSLNNVFEEYFFENINWVTGLRAPSGKWINRYEDGLKVKTEFFDYSFFKSWKKQGERFFKYELNNKGQIEKYQSYQNDIFSSTTFYEYIPNAPVEKHPFDFNRIGTLSVHFCSKETRFNPNGILMDSTVYSYNSNNLLIKEIKYEQGANVPTITKYKYNKLNQIVEKTRCFLGETGYSYTYNKLGLKKTWTSFDEKRVPQSVVVYTYK
jgi:hypothetical protein